MRRSADNRTSTSIWIAKWYIQNPPKPEGYHTNMSTSSVHKKEKKLKLRIYKTSVTSALNLNSNSPKPLSSPFPLQPPAMPTRLRLKLNKRQHRMAILSLKHVQKSKPRDLQT
jgi:hypothetical protein